eukprot:11948831-Alexandrium_andersonii.AAC.1
MQPKQHRGQCAGLEPEGGYGCMDARTHGHKDARTHGCTHAHARTCAHARACLLYTSPSPRD